MDNQIPSAPPVGVFQSLKDHWGKYGVIAVAVLIVLAVGYRAVYRATSFVQLYGDSMLWLSPRSAGSILQHGVESKHKNSSTLPGHTSPASYIPPEATIDVMPKDPNKKLSDVVNVSVHGKLGFTFEPGLDLSPLPAVLGVDAKLLYAWKLGAEVGISSQFYPNQEITPTLGLSWRLDSFRYLKNTELKLSYAPLFTFPAYAGIRINF